MRLSIGLPNNRGQDGAVKDSIALYCRNITVRKRTLIASVDDAHDFAMALDSLHRDELLSAMRWVNFSVGEDHP